MRVTKGLFILIAILATGVGLYPLIFLAMGLNFEFLAGKETDVLTNVFWSYSFYIHILFGGIALLIGWTQFSEYLQSRYIQIHRKLGKAYVLSALLSALSGTYIGFSTEGGTITSIGFMSLGLIWFYSTLKAYLDIKVKKVTDHKIMMIYSYASCLAAVTLRLWMPLLDFLLNDTELAYKIVAWWSWVPNLLVAHFIIKKSKRLQG